jgi:hypothetical protein
VEDICSIATTNFQYSVFSNCSSTVTVSPSGPRKCVCLLKLFKGVTTAMSGVLARFPLLLPVRNPVAGYGASAVTRTPDRGHVAEVKKLEAVRGEIRLLITKYGFPTSSHALRSVFHFQGCRKLGK